MSIIHIGCAVGMLFAFVLAIISLSTPGWIYTNYYAQGLFQNYSGDIIRDVDKSSAERVAIAFLIMGIFFLFAGIIGAMIAGAKEANKMFGKGGGALALVAGLFFIIGTASYTGLYMDFVDEENVSWGYSFAFAWTAASIAILAAPGAIIA